MKLCWDVGDTFRVNIQLILSCTQRKRFSKLTRPLCTGELDSQWPRCLRTFGCLASGNSLSEFLRTVGAAKDSKPSLLVAHHQDPCQRRGNTPFTGEDFTGPVKYLQKGKIIEKLIIRHDDVVRAAKVRTHKAHLKRAVGETTSN